MNMVLFKRVDSNISLLDENDTNQIISTDVTVLRKTCVHTWESVLRFISWHNYSWENNLLWDSVVRTKVSIKVFLLLHVPKYRDIIIKDILYMYS